MTPFLRTFSDDGAVPQAPALVGVVMTTVLRPSIADALRSVFRQRIGGPAHVVIGIDVPGDMAPVEAVCRERPSQFVVQVLWLGYSTSSRHGGVHLPGDGGAMRSLLTSMVNSRRVAYLDDDNWWDADHLPSLLDAMEQTDWAFSYRWWVQPVSRRPVCVDTWESVGPDCGVYAQEGGWVDPNCLMLDKLACFDAVAAWIGLPQLPPGSLVNDRLVFDRLRARPGTGTGRPTVFYQLSVTDVMHAGRVERMGHAWSSLPETGLDQGPAA